MPGTQMQVHMGLDTLRPEWPRCIACIGTFDGVHLGHREVIGKTVEIARQRELPAVVVTFDRHPAAILAPDRCPPAIGSLNSNLEQFRSLGVSLALILPFKEALANTSADDFLARVLVGALHSEAIVMGHDFAFGHDRVGNAAWLKERIATEVVPPFEIEGVRVSSSMIRRAIAEGRMEDAAKWLGRPYKVEGVVVHGAQLGRKLGYPTANLARTFFQATPADGVYAGTAHTEDGSFLAAISIGARPTIDETSRTIEAYLLDYKGGSLYGKSIALDIQRRLRAQEKFEDLEALKEQMARDVQTVRG